MTPTKTSRRTVLGSLAGTAALVSAYPVLAQRKADAPIDAAELMKPDALGDLVLGKADAPCTIVEYASMTCGHCASFHTKVFPTIKEKYIATGKVRFIMREFPLDTLAAAASMLARCAGGEKTIPMIDVLFSKQEDWAFQRQNAVPELFKIAKQAGFTQESFDKCLTDQALLDKISAGRERASNKFGVDSTPAFFINGKRMKEGPTVEGFEKAIAEAIKS